MPFTQIDSTRVEWVCPDCRRTQRIPKVVAESGKYKCPFDGAACETDPPVAPAPVAANPLTDASIPPTVIAVPPGPVASPGVNPPQTQTEQKAS
jgi:hypothetical protein